jgi:hypothetical protein
MGHFLYYKHVERVICIILVFSLKHECGMDGSLIRDSECVYVEFTSRPGNINTLQGYHLTYRLTHSFALRSVWIVLLYSSSALCSHQVGQVRRLSNVRIPGSTVYMVYMHRIPISAKYLLIVSYLAVNCPALVPPSDAQILYLQANILSPYQTGSTAILICPLGFLPTGLTTAICGPDGAWNNELGEEKNAGKTLLDSGSCTSPVARDETAATCPDLLVLNGFVGYDLYRPRQSGTSAILFCNIGFLPTGNTLASCDSTGTWSATLGTCNPIRRSSAQDLRPFYIS